jgi:cytochrome c biogenesis protein CcmG/thiol:disulfide interchange protein DsbE
MERTPIVLSIGLQVFPLLLLPAAISRAELVAIASKPVPQFVLKDLAGKDVKPSDFDGKALLVFFWTTGDKWCQAQLKSLIELHQQYSGNEFTVLGISLDDKGKDAVKAFAASNKINFPIVMGDYKVVQDFGGLTAIPTIFVLEKNHNIVQKHVGVVEKNTLENAVKSILGK